MVKSPTGVDQYPGITPDPAETRGSTRIDEAFGLYDQFMPPDEAWVDNTAVPFEIVSNNPLVDGESSDIKAALFDPHFTATVKFYGPQHTPFRITAAKYKVLAADATGNPSWQFRRHFEVDRLDASEQREAKRAFVLHEPNATPTRHFGRRLETGISRPVHDNSGQLKQIEFSLMKMATAQELETAIALLQKAVKGEAANIDDAIRRAQVYQRASRRRPIRVSFGVYDEAAFLPRPRNDEPRSRRDDF